MIPVIGCRPLANLQTAAMPYEPSMCPVSCQLEDPGTCMKVQSLESCGLARVLNRSVGEFTTSEARRDASAAAGEAIASETRRDAAAVTLDSRRMKGRADGMASATGTAGLMSRKLL